jgi:NAD(P)-dependent dehydrogenase (short-subunit alcohol dehydrogenase family)
VRQLSDGEALAGRFRSGTIIPVRLDVTDREQIARAAEQIRSSIASDGLNGIVNSAAIAVAGPLEFIPPEAIVLQFEVNVVGSIAVTQAFLPMIRTARGRIVLMGSTSGVMCKPFAAPYGASKHAIEAIADSLRVELHAFHIHVALIEPGATRTRIWQKAGSATEQILQEAPRECEELYGRPLAAMRRLTSEIPNKAISPMRVTLAVAHALEARRPRTRYRVGWDSRAASILVRFFPDRFRDWLLRRIMGI